MSTIDRYLTEVVRIAEALPRPAIQRAVDVLFQVWQRGGTVFALGNGGSASTATHFACDLAKCTMVPGHRRFKVASLCDNMALFTAWMNDAGPEAVYAEQLEPWFGRGDALVVFSVHGGGKETDGASARSQNLVRAVRLAKERGAAIIAFSGFKGGVTADLADAAVVVPIDREPLGTPMVESFHVVLHHLLCLGVRERIAASTAP